jgi:anti-sigma regulatory factor (Ser/Thr protein kinase)
MSTTLSYARGCGHAPRAESHHGLRVDPRPQELSRARGFAADAAQRFGLGPSDTHDFQAAASEAVANAIEHGLPCWDGAIHLWTCEGEQGLTFGVRNAGPFHFAPPSDDPLAEGGRGLALMSNLVDGVALTQVGGDVVVELYIDSSRVAGAQTETSEA